MTTVLSIGKLVVTILAGKTCIGLDIIAYIELDGFRLTGSSKLKDAVFVSLAPDLSLL